MTSDMAFLFFYLIGSVACLIWLIDRMKDRGCGFPTKIFWKEDILFLIFVFLTWPIFVSEVLDDQ